MEVTDLEQIGAVNKLSRVVVDQQGLGDAVNLKALCAAAAADDRAPTRLRRRRTHRVVGVRAGNHLAQPIERRRQLVEPVDGSDIEPARPRVQSQVRHVERHAVEQSDTQLLQRRNRSTDHEHHQTGQKTSDRRPLRPRATLHLDQLLEYQTHAFITSDTISTTRTQQPFKPILLTVPKR